MLISSKACSRCKETKSAAEFWRCKGDKTGLGSYCKACAREVARAYRAAHPEKYKHKRRYYYPERERAWHERQYRRDKERVLARNKAWARANPDKVRRLSLAGTNRRRVVQLRCEGSHTEAEWNGLVAAYGGRCACCGRARKLSRDHIVPLVKGGSDFIENIQPLCRECNSSKGVKTIVYRPAEWPEAYWRWYLSLPLEAQRALAPCK